MKETIEIFGRTYPLYRDPYMPLDKCYITYDKNPEGFFAIISPKRNPGPITVFVYPESMAKFVFFRNHEKTQRQADEASA